MTINAVAERTPVHPDLEIPRHGKEPLSVEELRWCRTEVLLLAGEAKEVDQNEYWEIYDYNQNVQRYRNVCLDRTFSQDASRRVASELTPITKQGIRDAGVRRFAFGRINRNENRIYITSKRTSVFDANHPHAIQIADLRRWDEAFLMGQRESDRVEVEWSFGLPPVRRTGWIDETSYLPGSGHHAREEHCRAIKGAPLEPEELVRGSPSRDRFMLLQVRNPTPQDAYVKLVRLDKEVVVAFLVNATSNRTINGLPKGEFEVVYATGYEFSRGCDSFVIRGFAGRVSQPIIFDDYSYEWEISLKTPSMDFSARDTRAYAEFEAL